MTPIDRLREFDVTNLTFSQCYEISQSLPDLLELVEAVDAIDKDGELYDFAARKALSKLRGDNVQKD